jgi:FKBP-type peptidyl-prolyl cis-trans isomerase
LRVGLSVANRIEKRYSKALIHGLPVLPQEQDISPKSIFGMLGAALFLVSACSQQRQYPGVTTTEKEDVTPSGLLYIELAHGEGAEARNGMMVAVHYTGYLMDSTKFDSSLDRNDPIRFVLGEGRVIKGWDEGLLGMRVGQRRKLIIPPQLGYADRGVPGLIPPGAELVFDVELVEAKNL